jgi:hypothetical protein
MKGWRRVTGFGLLAAALVLALGAPPSMAASRAHVYLLRGLMNIFSLGMDTLCTELNNRGVYATVANHTQWQSLADEAASNYRAGKEGPIILIGHSLGADAVMEMANYLGTKGIPVALVVPFDGTQSLAASSNVARVLNLTQRNYAYMKRGAGFHGTLVNVDVSSDPNIDHLTIDKSPRLHARVIAEVLAVAGGHRGAEPGEATNPAAVTTPASAGTAGAVIGAPAKGEAAKPAETPATPAPRAKSGGDGAMNAPAPMKPVAESGGAPIIALPERSPAAKPAAPLPN